MLKLIKLEWKKNHVGTYIRNAVLLAGILCLFLFATAYLGIANDPDMGVPDAAPGMGNMSASIELLTSMSFLIFTSAMLSSFIVSAYQNKTMNLMFSYPIKRQKILISQMLAVWIFCFSGLTLTKLVIYGCIRIGGSYMESAFPIDFNMASPGFYIQLIVKSAVIVTMSFISLFVGLKMRSSKAAVISSFLLVLLTQANIGDLTMRNNAVFPVILTLISLAFAFLSIYRAETRDLI